VVSSLNKRFLAFGIILLFLGVVLASNFNLPVEKPPRNVTVDSVSQAWAFSKKSSFEAGDIVVVRLVAGEGWWTLFARAPPGYAHPVNMTVVGPTEHETTFMVFFAAMSQPEPDPETGEIPLYVYNITYAKPLSEDLEFREPREIGGIVKRAGEYFVRCDRGTYWPRSPPSELVLYKEVHEKEYPYAFLLPVGTVFGVSGVAVSMWGAKGERHKMRTKRKAKR